MRIEAYGSDSLHPKCAVRPLQDVNVPDPTVPQMVVAGNPAEPTDAADDIVVADIHDPVSMDPIPAADTANARIRSEMAFNPGQPFRTRRGIIIGDSYNIASTTCKAGVQCLNLTGHLYLNQFQRQLLLPCPGNYEGFIITLPHHHQDLIRRFRLCGDRGKTAVKILVPPITRNENGDARHFAEQEIDC
jgi:hypothetical protein